MNKKELENDIYENCNVEIDLDNFNSWYELMDHVMDQDLCYEDVIYYHTAITYLMENDNSLQESMGLAAELCYSVENINSELLATLLKSKNNKESFVSFEDSIEEYYSELED